MAGNQNLNFFLSSVIGKHHLYTFSHLIRPVVPSSTLFFEVVQDNAGDNYVEAYFNDEPLPLGGCQPLQPCKVEYFVNYLKSIIAFDDVSKACQEKTFSEILI